MAVSGTWQIPVSVPRRAMSSADDLVAWMDELFQTLVPAGRFDLMGMSFGGWLAALYALRRPERVRRLVLLAPGGTVLRFSRHGAAVAVDQRSLPSRKRLVPLPAATPAGIPCSRATMAAWQSALPPSRWRRRAER
jgi:pimeloyl-ACP methyl ester carboxylesterase